MTSYSYSGKDILAVITDFAAAKTQKILLSFVCNQKLWAMSFDCTKMLKLLHGSLIKGFAFMSQAFTKDKKRMVISYYICQSSPWKKW